jgi:hypothetical protein
MRSSVEPPAVAGAQAGAGPGFGWSPAAVVFSLGLTAALLALWVLPHLWYTRTAAEQRPVWLAEATNAPGWRLTIQPVDKSAEAVLAADALFLGEFSRSDGATVRLFTARRFQENPNEIGLFVHTPDRCWTEAGWRIEPVELDFVEVPTGSGMVGVERRLFVHSSGVRELVYFFGRVGGQLLPYRLDHNLGVGQRLRGTAPADRSGTALRATDNVLWTRVWESFWSRRQLLGPKEFIRISTAVLGGDVARADDLLREGMVQLLVPREYGGAGRAAGD